MKNLITIIGSMLIMSMFFMQFAANEKTYMKEKLSEVIVYKNMNSLEDLEQVKILLTKALECPVEMIDVKVDEEKGSYCFRVPIYGIIGAEKIVKIPHEKNFKYFNIEGLV